MTVASIDCAVVGAGVVGLAVARALARAGREVVVLEAEGEIGTHASSRNSEVIHAGIYYPESSLKATLCVRGKELLYAFCREKNIAHRRIGKLIVATDDSQLGKLEAIRRQASRNGVDDLEWVGARSMAQLEPEVAGVGGLLSPSTGIIDSHAYMLALQADLEAGGGAVVLGSRVSDIVARAGRFEFAVAGERFQCRTLVNASGLWAAELASGIRADAQQQADGAGSARTGAVPRCRYAKGHYFTYRGKSPFQRLVYPLPAGGGLGIHATLDLAGAVRFGPDVTWINGIDYAFDASRQPDFAAAIRPYFPGLDERRLVPGYTGIRPRLNGPGDPPADFVIASERDHGVPGLVNLYGIESPGLTASLAIAEVVRRALQTGSSGDRDLPVFNW